MKSFSQQQWGNAKNKTDTECIKTVQVEINKLDIKHEIVKMLVIWVRIYISGQVYNNENE